MIQHRSGRLLAPLAFHRTRGTDPHRSSSFDTRAIALWLVSDDSGATWKEAPQWLALPTPATRSGLQEPGVVEIADGSLLSWFRTDQGVQFESRSTDRGQTWTVRKLVEGDADGWYCYTAIHFVDRAVLLAYCAGDSKIGGLNRLRIRRLDLDWLNAAN